MGVASRRWFEFFKRPSSRNPLWDRDPGDRWTTGWIPPAPVYQIFLVNHTQYAGQGPHVASPGINFFTLNLTLSFKSWGFYFLQAV
jgi:hypothetical protein